MLVTAVPPHGLQVPLIRCVFVVAVICLPRCRPLAERRIRHQEREACVGVRRSTIKLQVGPALYRVMEPGDQIIAGTWAMAGPGPWLDMLGAALCAPFIALGVAGLTTGAGPGPFWVGAAPGLLSLVPLVMLFWRRPVFVAVTQRQLICYRLFRMTNVPARLLFCAPPPTVRVTRMGRRMPGWRSIRYNGPGAEGRSLRLNVAWPWRRDLDEVLAALHARGASVAGLPSTQAAPLGETFSQ
jgi:hypothetical protein